MVRRNARQQRPLSTVLQLRDRPGYDGEIRTVQNANITGCIDSGLVSLQPFTAAVGTRSSGNSPGDRDKQIAANAAGNVDNTGVKQKAGVAENQTQNQSPNSRSPSAEELSYPVLVAGTFDTKSAELGFIADRLRARDVSVCTVDLSTSGKSSATGSSPPRTTPEYTTPKHIDPDHTAPEHIEPQEIAACHPDGVNAVFGADRGASVAAMAEAFALWIETHQNIAGIISAGGSGGTALATPAMRRLPIGLPKVMVSTVASGNVAPYVGPSDIMMMYSVTDVQGINRISEQVLGNAADALAGMQAPTLESVVSADKPAVGLTMFGVTTPAVQQIVSSLEHDFECLVFHATGIGGQSMEKLADSGLLTAAIDLTTTEVCDLLMGGVFAATEDRFDVFARKGIPYVGSTGALDMVNFGARASVPAEHAERLFIEHNPQVTLMRTTVEENQRMGQWIGHKLNAMEGPVRFLLPLGGVSSLDAPGQPFENVAARTALFDALRDTVQQTTNRIVIEHPAHINEPAFAAAVVDAFQEISNSRRRSSNATN